MSNISKNRQKTINLKSLILQPCEKIDLKFLNLTTLKKLFNSCNKELTERTRKTYKISEKIGQSEFCKSSREKNNKNISTILFYKNKNTTNLNNYKTLNQNIKKINNYSCGKNKLISGNEKKSSLNNLFNNQKELNKLKNKDSHLEFSEIKQKKKGKFIKIHNFDKKKLVKKFFENHNRIQLNLSRNNNNTSFKTSISNTLNDHEIYNLTQRNNYIENQKLISSLKRKIKNKSLSSSKNNKNNFKLQKNHINLLMKQKKNYINNTLPQRDKLLTDIRENFILKNKFEFKNLNIIIKKNHNNKNQEKEIIIHNNIVNKKPNAKIKMNNMNFKDKSKKSKILQRKAENIIFYPSNQISKENTIPTKNNFYKKVLKIDSYSLAGYNSTGEQKINQDSYFIKKNFLNEKDQYFIGVCDGHGDSGHFISSYIAQCLPNFLADSSDKNIISSFTTLNNNLVQNTNIDCQLSGSTCSSIIINKEKIISINLGDSRTVLAKEENGLYKAIDLSIDHKPNIPSEKNRILMNGGRIKPFYDDKLAQFFGPDRVWLKNDDVPGLAMTRSFGDIIANLVGVISEPEIKKYEFTGNEKFIIIASDGMWEYITSDECVNIIKDFYEKNMDISGAVNYLINEAFNRWKKYDEIIDDITAIIIFLEK